MKKLLFLFFATYTLSTIAQVKMPDIFPTPQEVQMKENVQINIADFSLINHQADADAVKLLLEITDNKVSKKASYKIIIGESTDPAIIKMNVDVPQYSGGYYLSITQKNTVLIGYDNVGTFYAIQTFRQLLQKNNRKLVLPSVTIRDYPSLLRRGIVEGFFGYLWTHQERVRQLNFCGAKKMNTYIYAPKESIYHGYTSEGNVVPYTKETRKDIIELLNVARQNKINLVWAIHAGKNMYDTQENYQNLMDKLQVMYNLGIRSFGLFFDEIPPENIDAEKQVALVNEIVQNFIVPNQCSTLFFCPSIYNKSYIQRAPSYLQTIKEKLNKDVFVLWTGDYIVSDISAASLRWAEENIGRKPFVWWNYPVNDFVKNKLLLGRVYGLEAESINFANGLVSNPMMQPEGSKIALSGVADFTWNSKKFDSDQSWKHILKALVPNCYDEFVVFAKHNADHGENFLNYHREESLEIKPYLDTFWLKYKDNNEIISDIYDHIVVEFDSIRNSAQFILDNCDNKYLLTEITPWLMSFGEVGKLGKNAMEICKSINENDWEKTWKLMVESQDIILTLQMISKEYAEEPYQQGVNTAQAVITPFIENLMIYNIEKYYAILSERVMPKKQFFSSNKNIENPYSAIDNNINTYTYIYGIMNEGDYFGINLGDTIPIYSVSILQGRSDDDVRYVGKGQLEYSKDGKSWYTMGKELSGIEVYYYGQTVTAQYIRYKIIEKNPQNDNRFIAIREMKFNISPLKPLLFTNLVSFNAEQLEFNSNNVKLTISPQVQQWNANDYIGVSGVENLVIDTFRMIGIDKNVVLETSQDGLHWNTVKLTKKNQSLYAVFKTHRERYFRCRNTAKKTSKVNFSALNFIYSETILDDSNVMFDQRLFTSEAVELRKKYTIPVERDGNTILLLLKDPIINNTVSVYAISNDNTAIMIGELNNEKLFYEFTTPLEYIKDIIFEGGKTEELLSISEIIIK